LRGGITAGLAAGNVGATLAVARGRGERFFAAGGMTTGGLGPAGDEGESLHRFAVPLPLTGEAKTRRCGASRTPPPTGFYIGAEIIDGRFVNRPYGF
jgi:hypothetical protein